MGALHQAAVQHAGDMAIATVHVAGHVLLPPVSEEQGLVSSSSTGMTARRSVSSSDPCHVPVARASAPASNAVLSGAGSTGSSVHGSLSGMLAAGMALLGAPDAAGAARSNPPSGAQPPGTASSSGNTAVSADGRDVAVWRLQPQQPQHQQQRQQPGQQQYEEQRHIDGSGI